LPQATAELEGEEESPVSYQVFCQLWGVLYPFAVNRPFNSLPGHCSTCSQLEAIRKQVIVGLSSDNAKYYLKIFLLHTISQAMDKTTLAFLGKAHLMHRGGHYMLERDEYIKKRRSAMTVENRLKPKILSLIIGILFIFLTSF
jgi:hypothetical protein